MGARGLRWALAMSAALLLGAHEAHADGGRADTPPQLPEGYELRLSGLLPDGTVRPGTIVDVAEQPVVTGSPTPEVTLTWLVYKGSDMGFGWLYGGPFAAQGRSITLSLQASNSAGRLHIHSPTAWVRHPPRIPDHTIVPGSPFTLRHVLDGPSHVPWAQGPAADGVPAPTLTFQWQRCADDGCRDVPGATAATYEPGPDDPPGRPQVVMTATNEEGRDERVISEVAADDTPPPPVIAGEAPGAASPAPQLGLTAVTPLRPGFRSADGAVRCGLFGQPGAHSVHCVVARVPGTSRIARSGARRLRTRPSLPGAVGILAPGRTLVLGGIACKAATHAVIVCRGGKRRVALARGRASVTRAT